ncbi:hypothetical protein [Rosenbergiella collisarenosi]|uniref:hypothetical protein n=1 Tax=Rosenbergiella collisarenosi TaxID=1544695 RepID=UPI001F4D9AAB|nr:hypothetical protein [Rosenbergiella collisarenosi]
MRKILSTEERNQVTQFIEIEKSVTKTPGFFEKNISPRLYLFLATIIVFMLTYVYNRDSFYNYKLYIALACYALMIYVIGKDSAKSGIDQALLLLKSYPLLTKESEGTYKKLQKSLVFTSIEESVKTWVKEERENLKDNLSANRKLATISKDISEIISREV